jgi:hypothetical protein
LWYLLLKIAQLSREENIFYAFSLNEKSIHDRFWLENTTWLYSKLLICLEPEPEKSIYRIVNKTIFSTW